MNKEWGLVQPGSYEGIYIEDPIGNTLGHGKTQMTDSLAVYDLFFKLDARFQTYSEDNFKELYDIFMGMEGGRDESLVLENTVDALGKLFVVDYSSIGVLDEDKDNREEL